MARYWRNETIAGRSKLLCFIMVIQMGDGVMLGENCYKSNTQTVPSTPTFCLIPSFTGQCLLIDGCVRCKTYSYITITLESSTWHLRPESGIWWLMFSVTKAMNLLIVWHVCYIKSPECFHVIDCPTHKVTAQLLLVCKQSFSISVTYK